MKIPIRTLTSAVCLILCTPSPYLSAFTAGSKAAGMASTGIAYPQDAYAGAFNPAGSVSVGDRFDIGGSLLRNHGQAKVNTKYSPANNPNGTFNAFRSPNLYTIDFGVNKNFFTKIHECGFNWSLGLVLYNRAIQKTTYKTLPLLGRSKLGLEYVHETISPLLSVQLTEEHAIGISLDVHIQRLKANGLEQFDHDLFSTSPSHVTNKGYAYSSGVGITVGWKWQPYEDLTFGVTYRPKTNMSKLHKYKGLIPQGGLLAIPERWGVGLAYQFFCCATLAFDVEWVNWQKIPSVHNPFMYKGEVNVFGSKDGPALGFRNQTIYRIGIDYAFNEFWIFRAGFRHGKTFVRKTETVLNSLLCNTYENVATAGFTFTLNGCNELSVFYAHAFKNTIHGKESIPTNLGSGNVNLSQSSNSLGITWGYLF